MMKGYIFAILLVLVAGCSSRDLTIEEVVDRLNVYKQQSTREAVDSANRLLENAVKKHPNNMTLIMELIRVNLLKGDWNKMEEYVDRGVRISGDNDELMFYRLKIFYGREEYEKFIANYKNNIRKIQSPHIKANIYHLAAGVYGAMGDAREEEKCFLEALKYYKLAGEDNVIIQNDIGAFYANQGNAEKAKQYFANSLTINANNYLVVNNLGRIFYSEGDYERALDFFNKSLLLNPNQPQLQEALEKLKKELDNNKNDAVTGGPDLGVEQKQ